MEILCVGGHADGRRVIIRDDETRYDAVESQLASVIDVATERPLPIVVSHYVPLKLQPITSVTVFALEGMPPVEVLERLIDGYGRKGR